MLPRLLRVPSNVLMCLIAMVVGIVLLAAGFYQDNFFLLSTGCAITVASAFLGIIIIIVLKKN
jgi:hypothetical protein